MSSVLLSVHVLAVVITIGPVTVAASMFPLYARLAAAERGAAAPRSVPVVLHRICRIYASVALFVPVFGLATAISLNVLTDPWIVVSIGLTVLAALLLVVRILPTQRRILDHLVDNRVDNLVDNAPPSFDASAARLSSTTGMFALLWTAVTVLMILRPGSTTGV